MQSPRIQDYQLEENQQATKENIQLFTKVEYGDEGGALGILTDGGSPNWFNQQKEGATAFHLACEKGMSNLVSAMLGKGAEVNARVLTNQNTPLHCAAKGGNLDVVIALIEAEADVNLGNGYGNTPLHEACLDGNMSIIRKLIESGANSMARNHKQSTPLHFVNYSETEASNYEELNRFFITECNIDPNVQDEDGLTPIHVCAEKGHLNSARLLLELGANIGIKDNLNHSAVFYSEIGAHQELQELLAKHYAEWEASQPNEEEEKNEEISNPKGDEISEAESA